MTDLTENFSIVAYYIRNLKSGQYSLLQHVQQTRHLLGFSQALLASDKSCCHPGPVCPQHDGSMSRRAPLNKTLLTK